MIRRRTISLLLALVAAPSPVVAQSAADVAARQELVAQADAARDAGDHRRALELATRASRIRMTPSLQLFLAQEQRALGHLVDAYANALACGRGALADLSVRNREAIQGTCESLARALDPLLGRVRIALPPDAPTEVSVRVDAVEVPTALRGEARIVMPGDVQVTVEAPGRLPFHQRVRVTAGAVADVRAMLTPVDASAVRPPPRSGPGVAPWITVGVGAAGVGAAGILFALAASAQAERDGACTPGVGCQPVAQDHDARYRDLALYGNVALGVGAALVVGGVVWYLVARPRAAATASAHCLTITF